MILLPSFHNSKGRVDLIKQYENECSYWRKVLKCAVSVICLLVQRLLAFRGSHQLIGLPWELSGNPRLLSEYDAFLAEHVRRHANKGGGHTSYLSSTVARSWSI